MSIFIKETEPAAVHKIESFGMGPYKEYRIPGIVVTEKGTLLFCYEGRMESHNDWAQIDIVVLRSEDHGKTVSRTVIADSKGEEGGQPVTWNNPVLVADGELIHLIYHKNYEKAYYCVSEDDGITFSGPVEITGAFREFDYGWNVCASGPGHGIVTRDKTLMVPVWIADGEVLDEAGRKKAHNPSTSGLIYSKDRGKTWHAGALASGITNANETSIAELPDGRILFNIRNGEPEKCRVLAVSSDGLTQIDEWWKEEELPDPKCFGSMVKMGESGIGFVNCANRDLDHPSGKRIFLTVSESRSGKDWNPLIYVDTFGGYADLAWDEKHLYVFYEQCVWKEELKRVNHLILKVYGL